MLNSYAYASQMPIIIFKASADSANNTISSAYPKAPANMSSRVLNDYNTSEDFLEDFLRGHHPSYPLPLIS